MAATEPERSRQADALKLAKRTYLAGERIDLGQLAQELGVSRVTLHRWFGTRDALLLEVVWQLTHATLQEQWAQVHADVGPRVPRVVGGLLRAMLTQPGARRFLLEENERAMRIFTHASYGHQPRLIAAVRAYLDQDVQSGRIVSPLSLDELAYATVRIAESYAYLPTIAGQDPDPDGAERVLEALLGRHPVACADPHCAPGTSGAALGLATAH